ncbi:hypothetical protein SNEBB_004183 [Seison nebaliae]|nr:hypothetical protein SNEBB_004183 [Seison nebaliae]
MDDPIVQKFWTWLMQRLERIFKLVEEDKHVMKDDNRIIVSMFEFVNFTSVRFLQCWKNEDDGVNKINFSINSSTILNDREQIFLSKLEHVGRLNNFENELIFIETDSSFGNLGSLMLRECSFPFLKLFDDEQVMSSRNRVESLGINHSTLINRFIQTGHRCIGDIETMYPYDGMATLSLPSENVVSFDTNEQSLEIVETSVVQWLNRLQDLLTTKLEEKRMVLINQRRSNGTEAGNKFISLRNEMFIWSNQINLITALQRQIQSETIQNIFEFLRNSNSNIIQSIEEHLPELELLNERSEMNLELLSGLVPFVDKIWNNFQTIFYEDSLRVNEKCLKSILDTIPIIWHLIFVIWKNSPEYHSTTQISVMINLINGEILNGCIMLLEGDLLRNPNIATKKLNIVLRIIGRLRSSYIEKKHVVNELNERYFKLPEEAVQLIEMNCEEKNFSRYRQMNIDRIIDDHKRINWLLCPAEALTTENAPWPSHTSEAFLIVDTFMMKCNDLLELVNSIDDFETMKISFDSSAQIFKDNDELIDENKQIFLEINSIYSRYKLAIDEFFSNVSKRNITVFQVEFRKKKLFAFNVTEDMENGQNIQNSFDKILEKLRDVVKNLEVKISSILSMILKRAENLPTKLRIITMFGRIIERPNIIHLLKEHQSDFRQKIFDELSNSISYLENIFDLSYNRHQLLSDRVRSILKLISENKTEKYLNKIPSHHLIPTIISQLKWMDGMDERLFKNYNIVQAIWPTIFQENTGTQIRLIIQMFEKVFEKISNDVISRWIDSTSILDRLESQFDNFIFKRIPFTQEIREENIIYKNIHLLERLKNNDNLNDLLKRDDSEHSFIQCNINEEMIYLSKQIKEVLKNDRIEKFIKNNVNDSVDYLNQISKLHQLQKQFSFDSLIRSVHQLKVFVDEFNWTITFATKIDKILMKRSFLMINELIDRGTTEIRWKNITGLELYLTKLSENLHHSHFLKHRSLHEKFSQFSDNVILWNFCFFESNELSPNEIKREAFSDDLYENVIESFDVFIDKMNERYRNNREIIQSNIHQNKRIVNEIFEILDINNQMPEYDIFVHLTDEYMGRALELRTILSINEMYEKFCCYEKSKPFIEIAMRLENDEIKLSWPLDENTDRSSLYENFINWENQIQDYSRILNEQFQMTSDKNQKIEELNKKIIYYCLRIIQFRNVFNYLKLLWSLDANETFKKFLVGQQTFSILYGQYRKESILKQDDLFDDNLHFMESFLNFEVDNSSVLFTESSTETKPYAKSVISLSTSINMDAAVSVEKQYLSLQTFPAVTNNNQSLEDIPSDDDHDDNIRFGGMTKRNERWKLEAEEKRLKKLFRINNRYYHSRTPEMINAEYKIYISPNVESFAQEFHVLNELKKIITEVNDVKIYEWLLINVIPLKSTLIALLDKWMFVYSKYLIQCVNHNLLELDVFFLMVMNDLNSIDKNNDLLKRKSKRFSEEEQGELQDNNFMQIVHLYNVTTTNQQSIELKFNVTKQIVDILNNYSITIPSHIIKLFESLPTIWQNIRSKIHMAKNRIGPYVCGHNDRIILQVQEYANELESYRQDIYGCELFYYSCEKELAYKLIDQFLKKYNYQYTKVDRMKILQELLIQHQAKAVRNYVEERDANTINKNEKLDEINQLFLKSQEKFSSIVPEIGKAESIDNGSSSSSTKTVGSNESHSRNFKKDNKKIIQIYDFEILTQIRQTLSDMKVLWKLVRLLRAKQTEWLREKWHNINIQRMRIEIEEQKRTFNDLPSYTAQWPIVIDTLKDNQTLLNMISLINDLQTGTASLRPRHWRQILRLSTMSNSNKNQGTVSESQTPRTTKSMDGNDSILLSYALPNASHYHGFRLTNITTPIEFSNLVAAAQAVDELTINRFTLSDFISLQLFLYVKEIKKIVSMALLDSTIEDILNKFEAFWMSKELSFFLYGKERLFPFPLIENVNEKFHFLYDIRSLFEKVRSKNKQTINATITGAVEMNEKESPAIPQHQIELLEIIMTNNIILNADTTSATTSSSSSTTTTSRNQPQNNSNSSNTNQKMNGKENETESLSEGNLIQEYYEPIRYLIKSISDLLLELNGHQKILFELTKEETASAFVQNILQWQTDLYLIELFLVQWEIMQNLWIEIEDTFYQPYLLYFNENLTISFITVEMEFFALCHCAKRAPNIFRFVTNHFNDLNRHMSRIIDKFQRFKQWIIQMILDGENCGYLQQKILEKKLSEHLVFHISGNLNRLNDAINLLCKEIKRFNIIPFLFNDIDKKIAKYYEKTSNVVTTNNSMDNTTDNKKKNRFVLTKKWKEKFMTNTEEQLLKKYDICQLESIVLAETNEIFRFSQLKLSIFISEYESNNELEEYLRNKCNLPNSVQIQLIKPNLFDIVKSIWLLCKIELEYLDEKSSIEYFDMIPLNLLKFFIEKKWLEMMENDDSQLLTNLLNKIQIILSIPNNDINGRLVQSSTENVDDGNSEKENIEKENSEKEDIRNENSEKTDDMTEDDEIQKVNNGNLSLKKEDIENTNSKEDNNENRNIVKELSDKEISQPTDNSVVIKVANETIDKLKSARELIVYYLLLTKNIKLEGKLFFGKFNLTIKKNENFSKLFKKSIPFQIAKMGTFGKILRMKNFISKSKSSQIFFISIDQNDMEIYLAKYENVDLRIIDFVSNHFDVEKLKRLSTSIVRQYFTEEKSLRCFFFLKNWNLLNDHHIELFYNLLRNELASIGKDESMMIFVENHKNFHGIKFSPIIKDTLTMIPWSSDEMNSESIIDFFFEKFNNLQMTNEKLKKVFVNYLSNNETLIIQIGRTISNIFLGRNFKLFSFLEMVYDRKILKMIIKNFQYLSESTYELFIVYWLCFLPIDRLISFVSCSMNKKEFLINVILVMEELMKLFVKMKEEKFLKFYLLNYITNNMNCRISCQSSLINGQELIRNNRLFHIDDLFFKSFIKKLDKIKMGNELKYIGNSEDIVRIVCQHLSYLSTPTIVRSVISLINHFQLNKTIVIYGNLNTGKSTLINILLETLKLLNWNLISRYISTDIFTIEDLLGIPSGNDRYENSIVNSNSYYLSNEREKERRDYTSMEYDDKLIERKITNRQISINKSQHINSVANLSEYDETEIDCEINRSTFRSIIISLYDEIANSNEKCSIENEKLVFPVIVVQDNENTWIKGRSSFENILNEIHSNYSEKEERCKVIIECSHLHHLTPQEIDENFILYQLNEVEENKLIIRNFHQLTYEQFDDYMDMLLENNQNSSIISLHYYVQWFLESMRNEIENNHEKRLDNGKNDEKIILIINYFDFLLDYLLMFMKRLLYLNERMKENYKESKSYHSISFRVRFIQFLQLFKYYLKSYQTSFTNLIDKLSINQDDQSIKNNLINFITFAAIQTFAYSIDKVNDRNRFSYLWIDVFQGSLMCPIKLDWNIYEKFFDTDNHEWMDINDYQNSNQIFSPFAECQTFKDFSSIAQYSFLSTPTLIQIFNLINIHLLASNNVCVMGMRKSGKSAILDKFLRSIQLTSLFSGEGRGGENTEQSSSGFSAKGVEKCFQLSIDPSQFNSEMQKFLMNTTNKSFIRHFLRSFICRHNLCYIPKNVATVTNIQNKMDKHLLYFIDDLHCGMMDRESIDRTKTSSCLHNTIEYLMEKRFLWPYGCHEQMRYSTTSKQHYKGMIELNNFSIFSSISTENFNNWKNDINYKKLLNKFHCIAIPELLAESELYSIFSCFVNKHFFGVNQIMDSLKFIDYEHVASLLMILVRINIDLIVNMRRSLINVLDSLIFQDKFINSTLSIDTMKIIWTNITLSTVPFPTNWKLLLLLWKHETDNCIRNSFKLTSQLIEYDEQFKRIMKKYFTSKDFFLILYDEQFQKMANSDSLRNVDIPQNCIDYFIENEIYFTDLKEMENGLVTSVVQNETLKIPNRITSLILEENDEILINRLSNSKKVEKKKENLTSISSLTSSDKRWKVAKTKLKSQSSSDAPKEIEVTEKKKKEEEMNEKDLPGHLVVKYLKILYWRKNINKKDDIITNRSNQTDQIIISNKITNVTWSSYEYVSNEEELREIIDAAVEEYNKNCQSIHIHLHSDSCKLLSHFIKNLKSFRFDPVNCISNKSSPILSVSSAIQQRAIKYHFTLIANGHIDIDSSLKLASTLTQHNLIQLDTSQEFHNLSIMTNTTDLSNERTFDNESINSSMTSSGYNLKTFGKEMKKFDADIINICVLISLRQKIVSAAIESGVSCHRQLIVFTIDDVINTKLSTNFDKIFNDWNYETLAGIITSQYSSSNNLDKLFYFNICSLMDLIELFLSYSHDLNHFFTNDEESRIINSMRGQVSQLNQMFSSKLAWQLFSKNVAENLSFFFIIDNDQSPSMNYVKNRNSFYLSNCKMIVMKSWNEKLLKESSLLHLKDIEEIYENDDVLNSISYLLTTVHLDSIKLFKGNGCRLDSNLIFQQFILTFNRLLMGMFEKIENVHENNKNRIQLIDRQIKITQELKEQILYEKKITDEREDSCMKMLTQIGTDIYRAELQKNDENNHRCRMDQLKALLPKYEAIYEKNLFRLIEHVNRIKKSINDLPEQSLQELRSQLSRPGEDAELIVGACIVLLRSASSDLSWNRGAKRLLANLDRFINELLSYDNEVFDNSYTLSVAEEMLKKVNEIPKKSSEIHHQDMAIYVLYYWVKGVIYYNTMMTNKIRPLKKMCEEIRIRIVDEERRASELMDKTEKLNTRLVDLEMNYEEASVDKIEQKNKTLQLQKKLDELIKLQELLNEESSKCNMIHNIYDYRLKSLIGNYCLISFIIVYLPLMKLDEEEKLKIIQQVIIGNLKECGLFAELDILDKGSNHSILWNYDDHLKSYDDLISKLLEYSLPSDTFHEIYSSFPSSLLKEQKLIFELSKLNNESLVIYDEGGGLFGRRFLKNFDNENLVVVNLNEKFSQFTLNTIEKSLNNGHHLIIIGNEAPYSLNSSSKFIDPIYLPLLIYTNHRSYFENDDSDEENDLLKFFDKKFFVNNNFRISFIFSNHHNESLLKNSSIPDYLMNSTDFRLKSSGGHLPKIYEHYTKTIKLFSNKLNDVKRFFSGILKNFLYPQRIIWSGHCRNLVKSNENELNEFEEEMVSLQSESFAQAMSNKNDNEEMDIIGKISNLLLAKHELEEEIKLSKEVIEKLNVKNENIEEYIQPFCKIVSLFHRIIEPLNESYSFKSIQFIPIFWNSIEKILTISKEESYLSFWYQFDVISNENEEKEKREIVENLKNILENDLDMNEELNLDEFVFHLIRQTTQFLLIQLTRDHFKFIWFIIFISQCHHYMLRMEEKNDKLICSILTNFKVFINNLIHQPSPDRCSNDLFDDIKEISNLKNLEEKKNRIETSIDIGKITRKNSPKEKLTMAHELLKSILIKQYFGKDENVEYLNEFQIFPFTLLKLGNSNDFLELYSFIRQDNERDLMSYCKYDAFLLIEDVDDDQMKILMERIFEELKRKNENFQKVVIEFDGPDGCTSTNERIIYENLYELMTTNEHRIIFFRHTEYATHDILEEIRAILRDNINGNDIIILTRREGKLLNGILEQQCLPMRAHSLISTYFDEISKKFKKKKKIVNINDIKLSDNLRRRKWQIIIILIFQSLFSNELYEKNFQFILFSMMEQLEEISDDEDLYKMKDIILNQLLHGSNDMEILQFNRLNQHLNEITNRLHDDKFAISDEIELNINVKSIEEIYELFNSIQFERFSKLFKNFHYTMVGCEIPEKENKKLLKKIISKSLEIDQLNEENELKENNFIDQLELLSRNLPRYDDLIDIHSLLIKENLNTKNILSKKINCRNNEWEEVILPVNYEITNYREKIFNILDSFLLNEFFNHIKLIREIENDLIIFKSFSPQINNWLDVENHPSIPKDLLISMRNVYDGGIPKKWKLQMGMNEKNLSIKKFLEILNFTLRQLCEWTQRDKGEYFLPIQCFKRIDILYSILCPLASGNNDGSEKNVLLIANKNDMKNLSMDYDLHFEIGTIFIDRWEEVMYGNDVMDGIKMENKYLFIVNKKELCEKIELKRLYTFVGVAHNSSLSIKTYDTLHSHPQLQMSVLMMNENEMRRKEDERIEENSFVHTLITNAFINLSQ